MLAYSTYLVLLNREQMHWQRFTWMVNIMVLCSTRRHSAKGCASASFPQGPGVNFLCLSVVSGKLEAIDSGRFATQSSYACLFRPKLYCMQVNILCAVVALRLRERPVCLPSASDMSCRLNRQFLKRWLRTDLLLNQGCALHVCEF